MDDCVGSSAARERMREWAPRRRAASQRSQRERKSPSIGANQQILGPLSQGVRAAVPGPVQERLHDLNSNLKEPRILVNNLLQLRLDAAARTTTRFVVNS